MSSSRFISWFKLAVIGAAIAAGGAAHAQVVVEGPITNPANGNLYYRLDGGSTIGEFRSLAQGLGGTLVTINDAAENQWVWQTFLVGRKHGAFIGLGDEAQEGTFAWESGQPVTFTAWSPGEPNGWPEEHFVGMEPPAPEWQDRTASAFSAAIVEVDGMRCFEAVPVEVGVPVFGTLGETTTLGAGRGCGLGWRHRRTWYKIEGTDQTLVVLACGDQPQFRPFLEVFTGPCDSPTCITHVEARTCSPDRLGAQVEFLAPAGETFYIAVSHPNTTQFGPEYTFSVEVQPTGSQAYYPGYGLPIYNPTNGSSFIVQDPALPYIANEGAARFGVLGLGSVNDGFENGIVSSRATPESPILIGFSDMAVEGQFRWLDGQFLGFTRWAPGQPDNDGDEDYTTVDSDGMWNDVSAAVPQRSVVRINPDNCSQAIPLPVPCTIDAGITFATYSDEETRCGSSTLGGPGVWYRIIGNGQLVTASTCDGVTNFDTTVRVFAGRCGDLSCVDGNNNACGDRSSVTFYAAVGVEYFMIVGKLSAAQQGEVFTLSLSSTPAPPLPVLAQSPINPVTCRRYLVTEQSTGSRFLDEASRIGGHGAVIDNEGEHEFVSSFIGSSGAQRAFIGLTDRTVEGDFRWINGDVPGFTAWGGDQPDNEADLENADYVEAFASGTWSDINDFAVRYGVVEIPLTAEASATPIRGAYANANGFIQLPDNTVPWLGVSYTIEAWIRPGESGGAVLGQYGVDGGWVPMLGVRSDLVVYAADWTGSIESSLLLGPAVAAGEWIHVAFTRQDFVRTLYVNGEEVARSVGSLQASYSPGGYSYRVGHAFTDGGWPQTGGRMDVDELRIWSSSRSPVDVRSVMSSRYFNPALYPDLVSYYALDDAGGRVAWDAKSSRHGRVAALFPRWIYENRDGDAWPDACTPICPADIDGNGVVNSTDVSEFINLWFSDQANDMLNADFNRDGVSNSTDVSDMINAYFAAGAECLT